MPPRYAYWTILIDGKATAFRAREREELVPTFNQLARKNTDIAMKYFARGKLWDTPEQAQWAGKNLGRETPGDKRSRDWRPGGEHKDPRARFLKSKDRGAQRAPRFPASKPSGGSPETPTAKPDKRPGSFERPYVQPRDRADRPLPATVARSRPAPFARSKDRSPSHTPYVQPKDRGKPDSPYVQPKDREKPETPYVQLKDRREHGPETPPAKPRGRWRPPPDRKPR